MMGTILGTLDNVSLFAAAHKCTLLGTYFYQVVREIIF